MKIIHLHPQWLLVVCLLLVACQPQKNTPPVATITEVIIPSPTTTSAPTVTQINSTPAPAVIISTPSPQPPGLTLCAPLDGYTFEQLENSIVNPYNPPPPGSDDPHQGIDIADLIPNSQVAIAGRPVYAILPGQTALLIRDRFPYGNAVLVETPLDTLSPDWVEKLQFEGLTTNFAPNTNLTCPVLPVEPAWKSNPRQSLYILYAHLQNPAEIKADTPISCGQQLGEIGESGNALNPHLHIEVRIGPSGARFDSMSHYDSGASTEEMAAYCTWRVSGWFPLVDPLALLKIGLE